MIEKFKRNLRKNNKRKIIEIDPDEILIDASNLPMFDQERLEGHIERPISRRRLFSVFAVFIITAIIFSGRLWFLEIVHGQSFAERSEDNRLHHSLVFAERGIIYDRNGTPLAWNEPGEENTFPKRVYTKAEGLAHVIGYVSNPRRDSSGNFYQDKIEGKDGAEQIFNDDLSGKNGLVLTETNAKGEIVSESTVDLPKSGNRLDLSIDSRISEIMNSEIKALAEKSHFTGGAGVMMDVNTGEVIALTSFPEYNANDLISGKSEVIRKLSEDSRKPFLNRVVAGTYTPGSIVKPFMALGVLSENLIDPNKKIYSSGKIEIQNPYNKEEKTVFLDWKAHGFVDMRQAIAVSSNVYFYEVGGGYEDQKGLGIANIEKYMRMFGFGNLTGIEFPSEREGVIPNPTWKAENFPADSDWRLGDTYHTAIGQYGFQVTPLQMVRGVAMIANNGKLLQPILTKVSTSTNDFKQKSKQVPVSPSYFEIVREGMRQGALIGTARALNTPYVNFAGKTGTAQLGFKKEFVNSWVIGFFPYEKPRYAFAMIMEHGPSTNLIGAAAAMRAVADRMSRETPEYFNEKEVNTGTTTPALPVPEIEIPQ